MAHLRACLLVLSLGMFIAGSGSAQSPSESKNDLGTLSGRVVDSYESVPIGTAFVMIYREDDRSTKIQHVNRDGTYALSLWPGSYDVLIGARSFAPQCRRMEIKAAEKTAFSPKLKPDYVHLQR